MNRHDLDKKRLEPCMADVFASSETPAKEVWSQSYDTWRDHGIWGFYRGDNKPLIVVPSNVYYLSENDLKNIVEKWCKGLHGYWYYIPKLTHGEPGYKKHVKELEDFRKFEAEVSKDKSLTYAQRAAKIKKEALAHNFMWRSADKEYITHNIYLTVSPTSNKEHFTRNCHIYNAIERAFNAGDIHNMYIDYVHSDKFTYTYKDGRTLFAEVSDVSHWFDSEGKEHTRKLNGGLTCNLFDDDGNFVDDLWDFEHIRREMSAETFGIMVGNVKPVVIQYLEKMGYLEDAKYVSEGRWADEDLQQCMSLFLMHLSYMEVNKEK